jgi:Tfp pilus assembly protein PilN
LRRLRFAVYALKSRGKLSRLRRIQIDFGKGCLVFVGTKLNLSSKPFRNRTLPWLIIGIVTVVSLFTLVYVISESRAANARADAYAKSLEGLRKQEADLLRKKEEINRALAPNQRQLLDAAHTLIDRKRFGWSRLFADLEAALPSNVRVLRINVKDVYLGGGQTSALLELAVMSKASNDAVTNMITDMERNGVFQAEVIAQNLPKGSNAGGMEWVLSVKYRPRAGAPTDVDQPATSVAVANVDGGVQ